MPAAPSLRFPFVAVDAGLTAGLDDPLPRALGVGAGTCLALRGWCLHGSQPIERLTIESHDCETAVALRRIERRDLVARFGPAARWSGFAALVPLADDAPATFDLRLIAQLRNGAQATATLARLQTNCTPTPPKAVDIPPLRPASIAVCMTTYNPRPDLFARQIASLRDQTERDWNCFVCDDGSSDECFANIRRTIGDDRRFHLYRQRTNAGFYHNFEQCLALAPKSAEFIALSDQDDVWHPLKLAVLRSQLQPNVNLVYSDARIVTDDGRVLAPTYWTTRQPNRGDFGSLLIANTVTGAAAMMRRSLLDTVLPFPPKFGAAFHDHWLACAALATGDIAYIDRPLYDYVQHGRNVIGHFAPAVLPAWTRVWRWCKFFWPPKVGANVRELLGDGRSQYFDNLLRVRQLAQTLQLRCSERLTDQKRRALENTGRVLDLIHRGFRYPSGVSPTVGMEFCLLRAHIWATYMRAKAGLNAMTMSKPSVEERADDARNQAA